MNTITFFPVSEAATLANVTKETIRNLCKANTIRFQMRGNLFYPCKEDVVQYAQSISEINQIERDIDSYKADIAQQKDELEQASFDLRERLIAINMFPHRIQCIFEILSAVFDQFEQDKEQGLTPRELNILYRMLHGQTLSEAGECLHLERERVRKIYYKALRKLAVAQNAIQAKDETIKELRQKIEDLQRDNKELKEGQYNENIRIFFRLVEDCHFSNRTVNGLTNAGIHTVLDLVRYDGAALCKLRNLGGKSIAEIETWLAEHNLKLGMELPLS